MRGACGVMVALLYAVLLTGCGGEPKTGPVEVKWDRDVCARCSMVLSDRNFAAQVRGGPKYQSFKFDDFGCAVFWLEKTPWADDPGTEFWVESAGGEKWLDARKAHYVAGKTTPMGYGLGAVELPVPGSLSYEQARKLVLARGK